MSPSSAISILDSPAKAEQPAKNFSNQLFTSSLALGAQAISLTKGHHISHLDDDFGEFA